MVNNSDIYKVSAVYLKILNLRPLYQSKRSIVIPFALFLSSVGKKSEVYSFLVERLNSFTGSSILQTIQILVLIYLFAIWMTYANEITGLLKSFKASHCCRFYFMSSAEMNEIFVEDHALLRHPTVGRALKKFSHLHKNVDD